MSMTTNKRLKKSQCDSFCSFDDLFLTVTDPSWMSSSYLRTSPFIKKALNSDEENAHQRVETAVELGTLIRKRRKYKKLTQKQLSKLCGVGERFISEVENGKNSAEIGKVFTLLSVLDLHVTISVTD